MEYNTIKTGLSKFEDAEVVRYLNYLKSLEVAKTRDGKLKNPWFQYVTPAQAIDLYKKVAIDSLSIDGEMITIQYKGKLIVSYNYQAYKNLVLNIYPETIFDIQIVHKGDDFSFRKDSGKVIYSHKLNDPFNPNPEIIGAYAVIKNRRGEFLEIINATDIAKMRAVAKTQNVWDTWFSEMVLKSVIKRACKRHFKDIVTNADNIDNENYDLTRVGFDENLLKKIDEAKDFKTLSKIYRDEQKNVSDEVAFVTVLGNKKAELMGQLPEITEKEYPKAIEMLKNGSKISNLQLLWKINSEAQQELITQAV